MKILGRLVLAASCLASPAWAQNLVVNSGFDLDPTDPANGWATDVVAPAGATSAAVELAADANGWTMNISWADVVVTPTHAVFVDGFESGTTSAWSR